MPRVRVRVKRQILHCLLEQWFHCAHSVMEGYGLLRIRCALSEKMIRFIVCAGMNSGSLCSSLTLGVTTRDKCPARVY